MDDFRTEPAKFGAIAQRVMEALAEEYEADVRLLAVGIAVAVEEADHGRLVQAHTEQLDMRGGIDDQSLFLLAAKAVASG